MRERYHHPTLPQEHSVAIINRRTDHGRVEEEHQQPDAVSRIRLDVVMLATRHSPPFIPSLSFSMLAGAATMDSDEAAAGSSRHDGRGAPSVATLGMFILDTFRYEDEQTGQDLGDHGKGEQIGGGGTYFAVGARIW